MNIELTSEQADVLLQCIECRRSKLAAWIEINKGQVTRGEVTGAVKKHQTDQASRWHGELIRLDLIEMQINAASLGIRL